MTTLKQRCPQLRGIYWFGKQNCFEFTQIQNEELVKSHTPVGKTDYKRNYEHLNFARYFCKVVLWHSGTVVLLTDCICE